MLTLRIHTAFAVIIFGTLFLPQQWLCAQVEHVQITHPVYEILSRWEATGLLPPDISLAALPLQRKEVIAALRSVRANDSLLSENERMTLHRFEREFRVDKHFGKERSALFPSRTDTLPVLFTRLFSDDEKFVFTYTDSNHTVSVLPLVCAEARLYQLPTERQVGIFADVGGRIFGTLGKTLGFFLQATSGRTFGQTPPLLLLDSRLAQSQAFTLYTRNFFEFAEGHVRFDNDWFYAYLGRESRQIGSGYTQRLLYSDNAMPSDAFMMGARLPGVEYRFTHYSLLGLAEPNPQSVGAGTNIPSKFMTSHRLAIRCAWGEVGFSESVVYSRRGIDMAYLVPASLLRTVTNNLRDRDNYMLNFDVTVRPVRGMQCRGTFILDDLSMPKIGTGWWGNKWAWNLGVLLTPALWSASSRLPVDAMLEYARVEPYTFSHFDPQNSTTNDGRQFAGHLPPNSDELTMRLRYWYGNRYPVRLTAAWFRHGANIVDNTHNLVRNVGGNILQTARSYYDFPLARQVPIDSETVRFLDGELESRFSLTLSTGFELTRQWNIQAEYRFIVTNGTPLHGVRLALRFEDF